MTTPTPEPDRTGWLDWDDYLAALRLDAARLAEVARMGVDRPVPSCPGWTVADLVQHTAAVYLHKVETMRLGDLPQDWPPAGLDERDPRELYGEATSALIDELTARDPSEVRGTWWPDDQTVGFWYRRMALETAVHRVDAELAHDVVTPIDEKLAVDGIDEVLRIMLGAPWAAAGHTGSSVAERVRVSSGGRSWTVTLDAAVRVVEGDSDEVAVEVSGAPDDVYLYLWGRRDDSGLAVTGDSEVAVAFRSRLAEVT